MDEMNQEKSQREQSIDQAIKRQKRKKTISWFIFGIIFLIFIALIIIRIADKPVYDDPSTPRAIIGIPDSKVVLIEYGDLQCPACAAAHPTVKQIIEEYKDRIRYEFHHFPLTRIHPNAYNSAQAAECANDQGKFYEYVDIAYENQNALSKGSLKKYAADLGLDQSFDECLDSGAKEDEINKDLAEAESLRLTGTPTFLVNGKQIQRSPTLTLYESLKQALEAEL